MVKISDLVVFSPFLGLKMLVLRSLRPTTYAFAILFDYGGKLYHIAMGIKE